MRSTSPHFAEERRLRTRVKLAFAQGTYVLVGALWPLLSMASFEEVTGNKRDEWLVRSVAGILLVLGSLLVHDAFFHRHIARTLRIMASGISLVLGVVALFSSLSGRVSWLYLPDGVIHIAFAVGWILLARRPWEPGRGRHQEPNALQADGV